MMRALAWWFHRPGRTPRGLRAAVAVVLGTLAVVSLAAPAPGAQGPTASANPGYPSNGPGGPPSENNPPSKAVEPPGKGNPTKTYPSSPALLTEGYNLYQESCSSCHGMNLEGRPGIAPSLRAAGAGPVDFYLSTGRMPLSFPKQEPIRRRPLYSRTQIDALIDFISSFGGPAAPTADPSKGDLSIGQQVFTLNCAGCHQVIARGGMVVGAFVPDLTQATAQQVAEAVRMGPYLMPHFTDKQINQHQLDSLARYVLWTQRPNNAGGWSIYNLGPIPEGLVSWLLLLGALVIVARLIGERTDEHAIDLASSSNGG